eukprot:TRINITY_DN7939_c0_g1_i1.p1 TRINITY_DN7939_c0_g1~~TRINITY_DN7939_c0_g1_i1.p1  ORF type:complete len:413 (+),score=89.59 TRINITY_DN7939_c0_g1_i1:91-1239(+)
MPPAPGRSGTGGSGGAPHHGAAALLLLLQCAGCAAQCASGPAGPGIDLAQCALPLADGHFCIIGCTSRYKNAAGNNPQVIFKCDAGTLTPHSKLDCQEKQECAQKPQGPGYTFLSPSCSPFMEDSDCLVQCNASEYQPEVLLFTCPGGQLNGSLDCPPWPPPPPPPSPPPPPAPPSTQPSASPSQPPSQPPSQEPTADPTQAPETAAPSTPPTAPSQAPLTPSTPPSAPPVQQPTAQPLPPTGAPSLPPQAPSGAPSASPTAPTQGPTGAPLAPSVAPTAAPSAPPTVTPSAAPQRPTVSPTEGPEEPPRDPEVVYVDSGGLSSGAVIAIVLAVVLVTAAAGYALHRRKLARAAPRRSHLTTEEQMRALDALDLDLYHQPAS